VPKSNNFDLIRLFAAAQVALLHSANHLGVDLRFPALTTVVGFFPGVPIFFFVSGFLISRSFERNPRVSEFARNRILRIYPALLTCLAVSLLSVAITGYFHDRRVAPDALLAWITAQSSVAQFFNPAFLRGYGVGVLNGSLWTISVELQFYVLVPCIYAALHSRLNESKVSNAILLVAIGVFILANRLFMWGAQRYGGSLGYELVGVTFVPWVYMFLVGVFFQRNLATLHGVVRGRFLPLLAIYCLVCWLARSGFGWVFGNSLPPVLFVILSFLIFAAAYSHANLSDRLLRRNDISYGIYIYHMPVVNFLIVEGFGESTLGLAIAIASTIALAVGSWFLIERPALTLKKHPLYQHVPANG
jgi:peptidoglycan/LPS O-acetylase OafA/YrhL